MNSKYNRWVVLVASVFVSVCIGGGYSWSVFIKPLSQAFGWTHTQLALAYSINMGIAPIPLLISSMLQNRFGEKKIIVIGGLVYCFGIYISSYVNSLSLLYTTYGLIAGFGSMIALSAILSLAVKLFPEKSGLALGLSLAGFSSSAIIVAPISTAIIGTFGVLQTFRILGTAMVAVIVICAFFIKDVERSDIPEQNKESTPRNEVKRSTDMNWKQMLVDYRFYIMAFLFATGTFTGIMVVSNAAPIGQEMYNLPVTYAAIFVGVLSAANGAGRIIGGSISDKIGSNNVFTGVYIATGLALLFLINSRSTIIYAIAVIIIGFSFGSSMVATASLIRSNFGVKYYSSNYAITFVVYTITSFFAPRVAATIKTANNGDYTKSFLLGIVLVSLGLVASLAYRWWLLREKKLRSL